MVQAKYEELTSYREEVDGPLSLMCNGKHLENGTKLSDYRPSTATRGAWAKPYAGECGYLCCGPLGIA